MGKVTVVGSYIVAFVMDVDHTPVEGETLIGRNYHITHGGKGSNMAVAAARLGGKATFLGKVGRDACGEAFLKLLAKENVDAAGVLFSNIAPTAVGFIMTCTNGTNSIVVDPAACVELCPADVDENKALIDTADVVLSPLEIPIETALAGARQAASGGKMAILNPAPASDLRGQDLSCVFALTPNETEGRVCLGLKSDDAMYDQEVVRRLIKLGPQHVILTLGARGVLWGTRDGSIRRIPALPVDVVDTVGAGDAFNAGLAVGLAEGQSVLKAIALGVVAASLSTRHRETIESYPYRTEADMKVAQVLASAQGVCEERNTAQ